MIEFAKYVLEELSIPMAILVFGGYILIRGGRALFKVLFSEEKGIVVRLVNENVTTQKCFQDFMEGTKEFRRSHIPDVVASINDLNNLKDAAIEWCSLMRVLARAYPDQQEVIEGHISEMERIIRRGPRSSQDNEK